VNELDLLELLRSGNDGLDSNFQFWVSSSFAVLMAFFFAHGKLVSYVKWTAISLYVACSVLFFIRMISHGIMIVRIRTSLEEIDSEFLTYGANAGSNIGLLFMSIVVLGTAATLYYCIFSERIMEK
jgi:hypothetical protein